MTEHGHTLGQMCSLPGPPRCCRQKAIPIRQDDEPEEGSLQPDVRPGGPTPAPVRTNLCYSGQMVRCNKNVNQARCC
ncbi:hypothetical protein M513_07250 [Trichuris suis]|uniref:Uncharacterized protein n=1 Tax=Trichuris suis TaxID=68888 RepID=A0A085M3X5_9BILA|nr:hypothetical protein M513_07250 [Trichuris suis]